MRNPDYVFEKTDTGWSAYSPLHPGVGVTADTREAAEKLLGEAISFHREGLLLESLRISGGGVGFVTGAVSSATPAGVLIKNYAHSAGHFRAGVA